MEKKRRPQCKYDCKIYGSRMCKEDGNTTFGYEEYGAVVCPVFMPYDDEMWD